MHSRATFAICLTLAALASCARNELVAGDGVADVTGAVMCPVVAGRPADLTADVPAKYAACQPLPLRQHWAGELPGETGIARIGASEAGLSKWARQSPTHFMLAGSPSTIGVVCEAAPGQETFSLM